MCETPAAAARNPPPARKKTPFVMLQQYSDVLQTRAQMDMKSAALLNAKLRRSQTRV